MRARCRTGSRRGMDANSARPMASPGELRAKQVKHFGPAVHGSAEFRIDKRCSGEPVPRATPWRRGACGGVAGRSWRM